MKRTVCVFEMGKLEQVKNKHATSRMTRRQGERETRSKGSLLLYCLLAPTIFSCWMI
jgi:hypothetical protein